MSTLDIGRCASCFQMKEELKGWEPLRNPRKGVDAFKAWKELLEDPHRHFNQSQGSMDPYERLVWDVWMPFIRNTVRYGILNHVCKQLTNSRCPPFSPQEKIFRFKAHGHRVFSTVKTRFRYKSHGHREQTPCFLFSARVGLHEILTV